MDIEELRARQGAIKARYKQEPATALFTLRAAGRLAEGGMTCDVETPRGRVAAGFHTAVGGDGLAACAGDMLLESLVACAGVTLSAVASAMGVTLRKATITAEGDLDFRGTLAVSKEAPIGFQAIRLRVALDTDADDAQLDNLLRLTERYCVVFQTLKSPPVLAVSRVDA